MITLLVANCVITGLMFCWWTSKNWLNVSLKTVWFALFVSNLVFTLKELNFI